MALYIYTAKIKDLTLAHRPAGRYSNSRVSGQFVLDSLITFPYVKIKHV